MLSDALPQHTVAVWLTVIATRQRVYAAAYLWSSGKKTKHVKKLHVKNEFMGIYEFI